MIAAVRRFCSKTWRGLGINRDLKGAEPEVCALWLSVHPFKLEPDGSHGFKSVGNGGQGWHLTVNSLDFYSIRAITQAVEQIHLQYSGRKLMGSDSVRDKRPSFVIWFLLSIAVSLSLVVQAAGAASPAAELLQAGDLIWLKKPGAIVPYYSKPGEADKGDAVRWQKEKKAYLGLIIGKSSPSPEEEERYSALQKMTYEEFVSYYLGDRIPGQPATYGLGDISVGHVGIIEISDGRPFVVEAMWGPGVQRLSYADWVQKRPGEIFWLGRLKEVPPEKRAAVAEWAVEQIGKPYNFWDFDLEDANGFYCSNWLGCPSSKAPDSRQTMIRILIGLFDMPQSN
jgi:hypothetical protein